MRSILKNQDEYVSKLVAIDVRIWIGRFYKSCITGNPTHAASP